MIGRWLRRQVRAVLSEQRQQWFPSAGDVLPMVTLQFDDIQIAVPLEPMKQRQTVDMTGWHISRSASETPPALPPSDPTLLSRN